MPDVNAMLGNKEDYMWSSPRYQVDLCTVDQLLLDEIAGVRAEVVALTSAFARLLDVLDVRLDTVSSLPGGKAAVFITRRDRLIESRHVTVYHQQIHDAPSALRLLQSSNWVFVHPTAAGAVLDALGVPANAAASA